MGRALVLSDHNLGTWRSSHLDGVRPSALPYGIDRLEDRGHTITSPRLANNPLMKRARQSIEGRYQGSIELPVRSLPAAFRCDVVISLLEGHAALPSLFKRKHIPPFANRPLIALTCWLSQDIISANDSRERDRLRRLADGIDLLFYFSSNQTEILKSVGISPDRLLTVPYGIDANFYCPIRTVKDIDVLAVGHDRGRDYKTLFEAIEGAQLSVDLVCAESNLRKLNPPSNVRIHKPVDHKIYRDMLRRAKVVVVPTRELAYPTGQSVALEASACGCCVIASQTTALSEYFDDGVNALLTPVAEPRLLLELIQEALSDDDLRVSVGHKARENVLLQFTTQHMWDRVLASLNDKGYLST